MEIVSSDYGSFHVINTPERSPTQSPLSNSPSPEQHHHSPRGSSQEQSLHIIVEPQLDGQTNVIYLMNPPSGQIMSSFIAENGAHIEIQPGVYFRVPFPHEHGYPYASPPAMQIPPHAYQAHFPTNVGPSHLETHLHGEMHPQTFVYNPACAMHGTLANNNGHSNSNDAFNGRVEKQREKLQKKLREKNGQASQCTCQKRQNAQQHESFSYTINTTKSNVTEKDLSSMPEIDDQDITEEMDIIICNPLKVSPLSPFSIIVSWDDCVSSNTPLQLLQFELELSNKGNNFKCIYVGEETSFAAHDLTPGSEYNFRLCAVLNGKHGSYSEISSCTTLCSVPYRPIIPRITHRTKNGLTLKWNAPFDGGSPIIQYKLQWSKGDDLTQFTDLYAGPQKQYKHNHRLPPLTPCMFRLQVENEFGASEFSEPLECLTSAGPPGVPEKPVLDGHGIDLLRLTWTQPECNGAPIEEYRLEMEDPNDGYGFMTKYCGENTSYTCSNLWRNTTYKFRLLASNNQGNSKYSATVEYKTLAETPGKMEKPKLNGKIKTHSIPVRWDPPKDNGGDEITSYIFEVDDGGGGGFTKVYHGPDLDYLIENLRAGTTCQLHVAAESNSGIGLFSPITTLTTLSINPRDVVPPRLSKQDATILYLEWDHPLDTGGSPITNYTLKMTDTPNDEFKQIYSGERLNCSVTGLECGTEYFFKLQASNSVGPSPWSKVVTFHTSPGPPDAPNSIIYSFKSPTHIRFEWTEPATHGTGITGYCIEKLECEVFQKVYEGNCLFFELKKNIEPATIYFFRMQTLSNVGGSVYSNICTVETPPGPPAPVTGIKVIEQTSSSCLIQWRNPVENGSTVFEYVIEATGATSLVCTVQRPRISNIESNSVHENDDIATSEINSDDESIDESDDQDTTNLNHISETTYTLADLIEYRLTGLTADASYKLRIQALNEVGASPFSHTVHFFTKELPPSPPSLNASSISYHSIKLKWVDSMSTKKSLTGVNHNLQLQNKSGSFSTVYNGMGSSFTLSKLKELTPYCFRIRSKNDAGEGEYSKPKVFYTKAQPPCAIKDLRNKEVTESSIALMWNTCEKIHNDDVIEYIVQKLHQDHEKDFTAIYRGLSTEWMVNGLQPDQVYQFRVQVVRTLSAAACSGCPTTNNEIKGIHSSFFRVRTLSESSTIQENEDDVTEEFEEEKEDTKKITDTQIAIVILGSFLVICILTAIVLRGIIGEY